MAKSHWGKGCREEKLLGQVLRTAMNQQALKPAELAAVNVDTTVQEKAIAFATDARLYDKARRALVHVQPVSSR
jgi:IS5 family transposase